MAEKAMTEEELRNLHTGYRLELSEHVESCLRQLVEHFPGFDISTVVSEVGWGAKIARDDYDAGGSTGPGRPRNLFSRLELIVKPFNPSHIVELVAKGTIRNKEVFHRTHFQMLGRVDVDSFRELIDLWVLEYAETFAAQQ